jgi:gamma-glutamyl-gamma-aminobutyrate hydrolase PuuD
MLTVIPNNINQDFPAIADQLDSFIITGGDDSTIRRTTELKLAQQMMLQKKPVIGICHGCFLLVDVLGGQVTEIDNHQDMEHRVWYFGESQQVNSYHNLCVKQLHRGATELAVDDQGHCEAWIDGNMAGVVWHPERMLDPWLPDEIHNLIFKEKQ